MNPTQTAGTDAPQRHALTYHRFMLGLKWVLIHLAALVVLLTVSFATQAGLGWGVVDALVVYAAGVYAMRHGLAHSTEELSLRQSDQAKGR
jgi:ABC-type polysaccharide/polyol phosphate export permease